MKILTVLLVLATAPVLAQQAEEPDERLVDVLFVPQDEETELTYAIPESALGRIPSWDPQKSDPPLPISKAVQIARRELGSPEDRKEYILSSIHLDAVHGRDKKVWYYMIEFYESTEWPTLPRSKRVLVMLDGIVLPPKSRPRMFAPEPGVP